MNPQTIVSKQDMLFQNLLVLGFDVQSLSKEYRISFEKKMFCLPNHKAFEVVSNFLFTKLNEVSTKKYIIVWPLLDVKAHREFQKTCFSHLTSIAQESDIRFPTISAFVLSSFGDPFYELYFAFSTHVVLKTNEHFGAPLLKRAQADQRFHKLYTRVLQVSTISTVKKFTEVTEVSKHHLETYFNCAKNLRTFIDKLKIANASSQALLEEKKKKLVSLYGESSLDDITLKKDEYQREIEQYWTQLENFLSKEEKLWNFLCTELDDENEKPILEGNQYNFSVLQDNLNKSHCNQHKHNLWTENKGLNIYELLRMFSCILELYNNSILKGNFSQTHSFGLLNNKSEYEAAFERLKQLSDQLQKDKVLIKDNIKQLLAKFQFSEDSKNTIYEDLPSSPSTCINTKSVNILDLEKFTNPSTVKDNSVLSNSTNNPSKECSFRDSLRSTTSHSQMETNQESLLLNLCSPISSQEIVKESRSAEKFQFCDDLIDLRESTGLENNTLNNTSDKLENILSDNTPDFNLPLSWLLEESLNSQSLADHLSFLD